MPKIVDHKQRRAEIGWAVARLIVEKGVQGVSVRAVAAAAGIQPSTLRHYFPTAEEMLAHALTLVGESQHERLAGFQWPEDRRSALRQAWLQALPLDENRLTETHVWLALSITARSDRARQVLVQTNDGLDQLSTATVAVLAPSADQEEESMALRAFTDGLALGAVSEPGRFTPAAITERLDAYLERLTHIQKRLASSPSSPERPNRG